MSAGRPCGQCGASRNVPRHGRHYKGDDGHAFILEGEYGLGMSEGYRNKLERRRPIARPMYEQECTVKVLGGSNVPQCSGIPTVHEPWTRARGGPIDDPRNMVPCCARHNTWLSQDVDGQKWGEANDLLIHEWEGPTWLAAGGVDAPKNWRSRLNVNAEVVKPSANVHPEVGSRPPRQPRSRSRFND